MGKAWSRCLWPEVVALCLSPGRGTGDAKRTNEMDVHPVHQVSTTCLKGGEAPVTQRLQGGAGKVLV